MQYQSSMQILPFQRVLVTIASHFLNFPPKALHAIVILNANPSLSKSYCHDCKSFSKLPPPKPYMQCYSSMHILPFHRVLVTIASHFLNFPPQTPTCNISPQCKSFPFKEFLPRLHVSPEQKKRLSFVASFFWRRTSYANSPSQ